MAKAEIRKHGNDNKHYLLSMETVKNLRIKPLSAILVAVVILLYAFGGIIASGSNAEMRNGKGAPPAVFECKSSSKSPILIECRSLIPEK
jgi:hypothetical protein